MCRRQLLGVLYRDVVPSLRSPPPNKIVSIGFYGNHYFSQRELLAIPFLFRAALNSLKSGYALPFNADGSNTGAKDSFLRESILFNAAFLWTVQRSGWIFFLNEGKQLSSRVSEFPGMTGFFRLTILRRQFETVPGHFFTKRTLEKDIEMSSSGTKTAVILGESACRFSGNRFFSTLFKLSLFLAVTEGPKVYLSEIKVKGMR